MEVIFTVFSYPVLPGFQIKLIWIIIPGVVEEIKELIRTKGTPTC